MSDKNTFIIAEIGQAHDGSLGILHSYIDAVSKTGADAIKFQTHIAEAESSEHEPFRVKFSYKDKTRFDYWKRMEFSLEEWKKIKKHCIDVGLEFISSPFSNKAVELLEKLGVKRYKVGSGEVSNFLLLKKIAETSKQIILSSGMSSFKELNNAINFMKSINNQLSLLQCTTKYPTQAADIGLNVIHELKKKYNYPIGLSDHSGTIYPSLAAVSIGAEIIEVHAVFDKRAFGPDSSSSLTIDELKQLVDGIRFIDTAINNPVDKNNTDEYKDVRSIFQKSLAVNKDLKAGDIILFEHLEGKKPRGFGLDALNYESIIGKKLLKDKKAFDFLSKEDFE